MQQFVTHSVWKERGFSLTHNKILKTESSLKSHIQQNIVGCSEPCVLDGICMLLNKVFVRYLSSVSHSLLPSGTIKNSLKISLWLLYRIYIQPGSSLFPRMRMTARPLGNLLVSQRFLWLDGNSTPLLSLCLFCTRPEPSVTEYVLRVNVDGCVSIDNICCTKVHNHMWQDQKLRCKVFKLLTF